VRFFSATFLQARKPTVSFIGLAKTSYTAETLGAIIFAYNGNRENIVSKRRIKKWNL
jgi:hypothetical protein